MEASHALSDWPGLEGDDPDDKVYLWRLEQFRQLGFSARRAAELAFSRADLGQARFLLGSGCALELALRILR